MTNKIQNDLRGNTLLKYIKKKTVIINWRTVGRVTGFQNTL